MVNWNTRCQCTNITNRKRCSKSRTINIGGIGYCKLHLNYKFTKLTFIIARWYKYYKSRCGISIYKQLPYDIQSYILFYMQEQYLLDKYHHKVINKIISQKILQFDTINHNTIYSNQFNAIDIVIKNMLYITYLVTKYYKIVAPPVHTSYCELFRISEYSHHLHHIFWINNESYDTLLMSQAKYYRLVIDNLAQYNIYHTYND